ncbi:UDP-N-acetylmuramoyl-L-alanyl-D-glutamate--2,6-diaminopimelate ligase [Salinisphaera sp. T31B1]|uniref:UDP-N-acetylmuramoyl-L-alanyl-D-glutamate--2, 6-diaminopimelate ligase n=1 Tax=Salinisphaera sp. T31B1 TaxID=727963 RepID=UPI00334044D6
MSAREMTSLLHGLSADDIPALDVTGLAMDSRRVVPGDLFLACQGTRVHGLNFVDQAVAAGARAIAWDGPAAPCVDVPCIHVPDLAILVSTIAGRFFEQPSVGLFVAGITGTDGKTSCAWLLARALEGLGCRCGYIGTLGVGALDALTDAGHTTPDPISVQRSLANFRADGCEAVAFEVSSHALDQHRVDGVVFDAAVLTQVGRDHLDYHASVEAYAQAKRRLFCLPELACAVLNVDDEHGRRWLAELDTSVEPVVYGHGDLAAMADRYVRLVAVEPRADGLRVEVDTHVGAARIDSTLIGAFNAHNLAAVLAVLLSRGESLARCATVLAGLETVPGRMQRIPAREDQPLVVVDYAHTPGALAQALSAVRAHAAERVLCVFGCGGDRDRGKRALMGEAAVAGAEQVWLTDDNPRSESPQAIVADILAGIEDRTHVCVKHDRRAAIRQAIDAGRVGDVVLIAGKGHETTQQIGDRRLPFDDRVVARQALEAA